TFLARTWKAAPEVAEEPPPPQPVPNVVHQVHQDTREVNHSTHVAHEAPSDDLDVPTFLRRHAQKA
nr:hypothetical protein [Acidobacteriota bacterium]